MNAYACVCMCARIDLFMARRLLLAIFKWALRDNSLLSESTGPQGSTEARGRATSISKNIGQLCPPSCFKLEGSWDWKHGCGEWGGEGQRFPHLRLGMVAGPGDRWHQAAVIPSPKK